MFNIFKTKAPLYKNHYNDKGIVVDIVCNEERRKKLYKSKVWPNKCQSCGIKGEFAILCQNCLNDNFNFVPFVKALSNIKKIKEN